MDHITISIKQFDSMTKGLNLLEKKCKKLIKENRELKNKNEKLEENLLTIALKGY